MSASAMTPATEALLKRFIPGSAETLRSCATVDWAQLAFRGERVTMAFDLPDDRARIRALELEREAQLIEVHVPGGVVADVTAWTDDDGVLRVDALVVHS